MGLGVPLRIGESYNPERGGPRELIYLGARPYRSRGPLSIYIGGPPYIDRAPIYR